MQNSWMWLYLKTISCQWDNWLCALCVAPLFLSLRTCHAYWSFGLKTRCLKLETCVLLFSLVKVSLLLIECIFSISSSVIPDHSIACDKLEFLLPSKVWVVFLWYSKLFANIQMNKVAYSDLSKMPLTSLHTLAKLEFLYVGFFSIWIARFKYRLTLMCIVNIASDLRYPIWCTLRYQYPIISALILPVLILISPHAEFFSVFMMR